MSNKVYVGDYSVDKDRLTTKKALGVVEKFESDSDVTPTLQDAVVFGALSEDQYIEDQFTNPQNQCEDIDEVGTGKAIPLPKDFYTWSDDQRRDCMNYIVTKIQDALDAFPDQNKKDNHQKEGLVSRHSTLSCVKRCVVALPVVIVGSLVVRGLVK